MVPTIEGWIEQWYGYVPGSLNVTEKVPPGGSKSDANWMAELLSASTVCVALPSFTHVTVVPAFTVSDEGVKTKSFMAIVFTTVASVAGVC
ncbi:MAG TPA: hypothetical protein VLY83_02335 [Methanoregula sp.]|nr:hypothetical protein [Methanoregula sp.]